MGLHKKTIKEIMMRAAKFQISEAAIYRMISVSEKFIEEKTRQAEKLLEEQNHLRDMQGLKKKRRLTPELIDEVFSNDS